MERREPVQSAHRYSLSPDPASEHKKADALRRHPLLTVNYLRLHLRLPKADHLDSGSVSCPSGSPDGAAPAARASSIFLRSSGLELKRLTLAKFFLWVRKPIPQIRIQRNKGRTTVRARLIRSRAADPGKRKRALTKPASKRKSSRCPTTSRITTRPSHSSPLRK